MKYLILALVFFVGCARTIYTPVIQRHTIVDTVVEQVRDSATLRALFECDSLGNVLLTELKQTKGMMANQSFDFADNELRIETRWRTKFIDRVIEIRDTVTVVEVREVVSEKAYIPTFFWICMGFTIVTIIYLFVKRRN